MSIIISAFYKKENRRHGLAIPPALRLCVCPAGAGRLFFGALTVLWLFPQQIDADANAHGGGPQQNEQDHKIGFVAGLGRVIGGSLGPHGGNHGGILGRLLAGGLGRLRGLGGGSRHMGFSGAGLVLLGRIFLGGLLFGRVYPGRFLVFLHHLSLTEQGVLVADPRAFFAS